MHIVKTVGWNMMWVMFHYSNEISANKIWKKNTTQISSRLNRLWPKEIKMYIGKLDQKHKRQNWVWNLPLAQKCMVQWFSSSWSWEGNGCHHKRCWSQCSGVQELLHLEFSLAYGTCCSLQSNKGWVLCRILSISKYFT